MKYDPKIVIIDIRTYRIMSSNRNYEERLFEAYKYIKKEKLNNKIDYTLHSEQAKTGTFTYEEISIFDRLRNKEYKELIETSWEMIHDQIELYVNDQEIGDRIIGYKK